ATHRPRSLCRGCLWDAAAGQPASGGGHRGVSSRGKRAFGQRHARSTITLAKDETFTGGLCLVAIEPKSTSIVLEQEAPGRAQDTWHALMEQALSGLHCQVISSTSDEAPGLLAYVAHHLGATTRRTSSMCSMSWSKR